MFFFRFSFAYARLPPEGALRCCGSGRVDISVVMSRSDLRQRFCVNYIFSNYLNLTHMCGGKGCDLQPASPEHNTEVCFTLPHPSFIKTPKVTAHHPVYEQEPNASEYMCSLRYLKLTFHTFTWSITNHWESQLQRGGVENGFLTTRD